MTDLFSNSFSAMVNAVVRVMIHISVRDENVEFARGEILRARPLPSYLSGHLSEVFGISPHPMNKDLLTGIYLQSDRIEVLWHLPVSEHQ